MEKQWYYGQIYDTIPITMELWIIIEKNYGNIQVFWTNINYSFRTLIYYGKTMVLWEKYGTMGKNYGSMEKSVILYRKLWNFDLLWKNYGTM